jgi:hypothetical protein
VSASGLTLFGPGDASADASGSTAEPTLSAPKLELTPIAFDFGPIALGFPARGVVFVFNSGNAPMAVPSVSLSADSAADFGIIHNRCEDSLEPGDSCAIRLALTPNTLGELSGSLEIEAGPGGAASVPLAGFGSAAGELLLGPAPGSSLDFSGVEVGARREEVIRVTNPLDTPSGALSFSANNPDFILGLATSGAPEGECGPATSLASGASCDLRVSFSPSRRGQAESALTVQSAALGSASVGLSGDGLAAGVLRASTSELSFLQIALGTPAAARLTLENAGDLPVTLMGAGLSSGSSADFAIQSSDCGAARSLAGGESCAVTVEFRPSALPEARSALVVPWENGEPVSVGLVGSGLERGPLLIELTPPVTPDFGAVLVNTSAVQVFRVTNPVAQPSGPLALSAGADFSILPPQPGDCEAGVTSLMEGQSCALRVSFLPLGRGPRDASLTVVSALAGGDTVRLSGSGVVAGRVALLESEIDFGRVIIGDASPSQVTVLNRGDQPLSPPTVSLVNAFGGGSGAFSFASSCSTALAPGQTCTIALEFQPSLALPHAINLRLDSSGGGTTSCLLLGEASERGALVLQPVEGSASFGDVETDTALTRQFRLTNPAAVASGRLTITVTSSSDTFSVDEGDCNPPGGAGLAPDASCTFGVTFLPTASGVFNGNLSVTSPGAGSTGLPLDGQGRSPATLSATTAQSFGTANIGQEALTEERNQATWVVANEGDLATGSLTFTNSNMAEFEVSANGCAGALAGHSSCEVSLRFRPQQAGPRSATLTLADPSRGLQVSLNATGNGVQLAGLGESCIGATCGEGTCTRGVCCDRGCEGTCRFCNTSGVCIDQGGNEACGTGGQCFGPNQCLLPRGATCSGPNGDGECGGAATCEPKAGGGFMCCAAQCTGAQICTQDGLRCELPTAGQGQACGNGLASCGAGLFCNPTFNTCCQAPCNGSCEACGANGACNQVNGTGNCPSGQVCQGRNVCGCAGTTELCNGQCISADACCTNTDCQANAFCNGSRNCECSNTFKICGARCISNNACCADADCQANALCNGSGACQCRTGFKACGQACIANSACCTDADCPGDASCTGNACVCDPGVFGRLCDGRFTALGIPNAQQTSTGAVAVSDDGRVVAGSSGGATSSFGPFRWEAGTYEALGLVAGFDGLQISGMSGDGLTIVGTATTVGGTPSVTARWIRTLGMQGLGLPANGLNGRSSGVSSANSVIFGQVDTVAAPGGFGGTWINGSFQAVPNLGTAFSIITAANADGSILGARTAAGHVIITRATGASVTLPPPNPPGSPNGLIALSADGSIAVGSIASGISSRVFLWRSRTAPPVDLGAFFAFAMTGNGQVIVGQTNTLPVNPIIWDATNGVRNLSALLTAAGANLGGLTLTSANDISADGRFVVGNGSRSGRTEPWLARLPTP